MSYLIAYLKFSRICIYFHKLVPYDGVEKMFSQYREIMKVWTE